MHTSSKNLEKSLFQAPAPLIQKPKWSHQLKSSIIFLEQLQKITSSRNLRKRKSLFRAPAPFIQKPKWFHQLKSSSSCKKKGKLRKRRSYFGERAFLFGVLRFPSRSWSSSGWVFVFFNTEKFDIIYFINF